MMGVSHDIRINLLPWREELREKKKQEFLNVMISVLFVAGIIIFSVDRHYSGEIEDQKSRNDFLKREITLVEERIKEIKLLQQKRNELLARMKVIQELQGNRPFIVRVFDELARSLAPFVFFRSLEMNGSELAIRGFAESNNRISTQLRNFSESGWFERPNVTEIKADPTLGPQASQFSLTVVQTTPKKEE